MPVSGHPPILLVVMGVSGCGKSSVGEALASHAGIGFIEGDQLHPPENVAKMASGTPLTDDDRWPWLDVIAARLSQAASEGRGLIVSCSALKKVYRDHLRRAAGNLNFLFLKGSHAVLAARMAERKGHFMPPALLDSQLATLEDPTGEPGVMTVMVEGTKSEMIEASIRAYDAMARERA